MTSAAEERIKYHLVSAVNAILKDERYGIGLVRDEFQLTHQKIERRVPQSADIFSAVKNMAVLGIGTPLVRRGYKRGRGSDRFVSGSFKIRTRIWVAP